jgi:hypothetical protein
MSKIQLTEIGKREPGSLTRDYRAFYKCITSGKEYVQTKYPNGKLWLEVVDGGGGGGEQTKPAQPGRSIQFNNEDEFEGSANLVYETDIETVSVTAGPLVIGREYTIDFLLGGTIPSALSPFGPFFGNGSGFAPGVTVGVSTSNFFGGIGIGLTVDVTADAFGNVTDVVINTPGSGYSLGQPISINGGNFDGLRIVAAVIGGDDFLNVGAPSNGNGITFTATGTTPTDWSNASQLSYGIEVGATVVVRNGGVDTPFVKFPEGFNKGTLSADDLQFADRTWSLPPRSGEISLIEDAASSRTLWVDQQFGNDSTAIPFNRQLPYRTVMAAITAANAGDLVHVRPGTYVESITLKDQVNVHCEPNVTVGSAGGLWAMGDGGVSVNCRWTGDGSLDRGFQNGTFQFTGLNTKFYGEFYEILGIGTKVSFASAAQPALIAHDIHIKAVNVNGTEFNGELNKPAGTVDAKWLWEVSGRWTHIGGRNNSGPQYLIFQSVACAGTYEFIVNELHMLNNNDTNGGTLIFGVNNTGPQTPTVLFEINEIINDWDGPDGGWQFIHNYDNVAWDLTVKVNKPWTLNKKRLFFQSFNNSAGITKLIMDVTGNALHPLVETNSTGHKLVIKDSFFKKPNTGADLNEIIVNNVDGSYNEYINSIFQKDSLATDTGEMITLAGATSVNVIKDCEFYLTGAGATGLVCDGPVGQSDVYFKNTRSNIDNGVNVVDTAVVSGFIANDTNLTDYKI